MCGRRGLTWRESAACRGMDTNIFFPKINDTTAPQRIAKAAYEAARLVCEDCPVSEECYWESMTVGDRPSQQYGMWGGLSPGQRNRRWYAQPQYDDRRRRGA